LSRIGIKHNIIDPGTGLI